MIHIARRVTVGDLPTGNTLESRALLTFVRQQRQNGKSQPAILESLPWTCHGQAMEMLDNAEYHAIRTDNPLEPLSANTWWCDVANNEDIETIIQVLNICIPCIEKLLYQRVFEDCVTDPECRYSPSMLRVKYNSEEQDFQCVDVQEFLVQYYNGMWRSMEHLVSAIEDLWDTAELGESFENYIIFLEKE